MRLTALVRKDLRRMAADRRALLVNLTLPLLLSFIMGLSFGGGVFGGGGLSEIPVVMVGEGLPEPVRERLGAALAETGFFAAQWADSAEAARRVREGDAAAAVVLPPDLTRRFLRGEELAVAVWKDPGSPLKADIVEQILGRMLARYQAGEAAYLALWPDDAYAAADGEARGWEDVLDGGFSEAWRRWRSPEGDPQLRETAERFLRSVDHNLALAGALGREQVVLRVHDKAPARAGAGDVNLFDYFLPGFAVFFLMFGVAAAARDIHRERDRGTLQRQLLSPLTGLQFLAGKWLAAALQGAAQLLVLFLAGAMLFQVNLGPDPWSLLTLVVLGSTAAAGFFVLMALVTPTEKVMDNLSTVVILVAAMLGGNMMPIDALPAWVHGVGRFVFNYWINLGFSNVVAKNRGLAEAPAPAVVLAAVTLLTLGLALAAFLVRRRRGGLA